ncbi:MAG: PH domain-containing protein [Methanocellales archaeon]|nr:PH domain-containing protein [Methanocellales archaeon]MDD4897952.1 PH domain-containing protein [Methanocellales archaeon]
MKEILKINVCEEFRPAQQFKMLYYIYLILGTLFGILPWYIPLVYSIVDVSDNAPFVVTFFVLVPLLALLIFVAYWIPKYYDTVLYKLTENEMVWRRGVWFKNTGIVPYNRITNIDIAQGPISRMLRIASLKIQTAGYSAPSGGKAEIKIEGMEQFEELRELIMGFVRGKKPVAVETYEEDIDSKILDELVKIRKSLEKSSGK